MISEYMAKFTTQDPYSGSDGPNSGPLDDRLWNEWRERLLGEWPVLDLPTDRPRLPALSYPLDVASYTFRLEDEFVQQLSWLAVNNATTLSATLLASYQVLLYRYTGQETILVASPTAASLSDGTNGYLASHGLNGHALLPADLSGQPTFQAFLSQVSQTIEAVLAHPADAVDLLLEKGAALASQRMPLCQAMFVFQPRANYDGATYDLSLRSLRLRDLGQPAASFDLSLVVSEKIRGLSISLEYRADLFDVSTIQRMADHFQSLLRGIVANPHQRVSKLPLLTEAQRHQLLVTWNDTQADYPHDKCIHHLFEQQVARTPDAVAVVFAASEHERGTHQAEQLTYREINARANQLAHYLIAQGVTAEAASGHDILVGLCLDRSLDMMVGLLGILKAGAAYVPLDPSYPKERIAFILANAQVPILVTQEKVSANLSSEVGQPICLDRDWPLIAQQPSHNPTSKVIPTNLAYVIYTSGSTGKPKGVQIPHGAVVNFLQTMAVKPGLQASDRLLAVTTLSFDIAVLEVFLPLMVGASTIMASSEVTRDGFLLQKALRSHEITIMQATPSTWQMLLQAGWSQQDKIKILCGGEALPRQLANQLLNGKSTIWNMYGPTEATIWATVMEINQKDELISIGQPIGNMSSYILDDHLQPVPIGVPGQLYLGGVGLARGYWQRPDLTAEKFIPHPFSDLVGQIKEGERLYHTGDLARYLPDGNIDFLGRIDHQVKVRGFRIELGEIESVLSQHPQVREVVVVAREDKPGDKQLVAYLIPEAQQAPTASQLRHLARQSLPDYMLPAAFVTLEAFPLTPNGKINRRALPAPDFASPLGELLLPRTTMEKELAAIWSQVLGVEPIGVTASFFELGGHSLLAGQLIVACRARLGLELSLQKLFEFPTIAQLATHLNQEQPTAIELPTVRAAPEARYQPFPLTDIQQAYWLGRGDLFELGNIAVHDYFELEFDEGLDLARLSWAWQQLTRRHEMLRTIIVDGQQQILAQVPPYQIDCLDLTSQSAESASKQLDAVRAEMSHQVLAIETWPVFDLRATRYSNRIRLHLSFDILIVDMNSLSILFKQWRQLYQNPALSWPPLELSFRDYVLTEQTLAHGDAYERSKAYWLERLDDFPQAPALPLASASQDVVPKFERREFHLDPALWQALKERGVRAGLTPSGLILAAFAEILNTWSKTPRFAINLTLFNRLPLHPQVDEVVGDFTSLTLLAVDSRAGSSFTLRAQQIQQQLWQDLDHRYMSGVEVLRELVHRQGRVGEALMPVVFTSALGLDMKDVRLGEGELVYYITQTPQVWLDHLVFEEDGGLLLAWDTLEALFPAGLLDDMFDCYGQLITRLATDDQLWHTNHLPLLPAKQAAQRTLVNNTALPLADELLHSGFLRQVSRQGSKVAVIGRERSLSYQELYQQANSIGHWLRERGAEPNTLVAVVMEKGWEQVVAVLAILMSGAAYLPIDPNLPTERQHYLLEQGWVKVVLTTDALAESLSWPDNIERLSVDSATLPSQAPLRVVQTATDLAYVIYTSGSTGLPKGVVIDHRGALNTVVDINRRFGVTQKDRVLALSALNFDLSVYDIFGLLAVGGTIVMPAPEGRRDPAHWAELMVEHRVTLWDTVPALMQMLIEYQDGWPLDAPLRLVMMSGDWIPVNLPGRIKDLWPQATIMSLGGATEASIWSIYYPIERVEASWKSIPYGKPLSNQTFHVLNDFMQPCPIWVPGELYIGGIGLAKGYWRDEEKTAARFIIHPQTGERLYKTGDLGRYLPDGNIEFLGREDFQVKIRGHRIELGEIEANLLEHPAVKEVVVSAYGQTRSDKQLVAYIVTDEDEDENQSGLPAIDGVLTDPLKRFNFQLKQPGIRSVSANDEVIKLPRSDLDETSYIRRQSYRHYLSDSVTLTQLSQLLSCLRPYQQATMPLPKYRYASAGTLYPVQLYLYIKPEQVEGLKGGTYYYHPSEHQLVLLSESDSESDSARIGADVHTPINRAIFEQSAFSLFLIGELAAIEPMYGSMARDFCLLEAGYMSHLLMEESPTYEVGLCPIGSFNFDEVRSLFALQESQVFLHSFLGGGISQTQSQTLPPPQSQPASQDHSHRTTESVDFEAFLQDKLPDYMLPEHYILLEALPLTANGKVNRKALPEPEISHQEHEMVAAVGELEESLAAIVKRVLGLEEVGVTNNFFSVGANSLHVVQIYNEIQKELEAGVQIGEIFAHPTIRALADRLKERVGDMSETRSAIGATSASLLEDEPLLNSSNDLDAAEIEHLLANVDHMSDQELDALLNVLGQ